MACMFCIIHANLEIWNCSSTYSKIQTLTLTSCISSGQFDVVKFLLQNSSEKGIDISKKNNNQRTAEDLARIKNHKDILELFEAWFEVSALCKTIETSKLRLEALKKKHFL